MEVAFQNRVLASLARDGYGPDDLSRIESELHRHETLRFLRLSSGLFAASAAGERIADSGYGNVWVRDNVYVAYAHHRAGQSDVAAAVARALFEFFDRHRRRFEDIISGAVPRSAVSLRPQIRFDGEALREIETPWAHAQNDALGYFLWLYATLASEGHVRIGDRERSLLRIFPRYFRAIEFWSDEDCGHWEETPKVSASSIGTVVAGLEALQRLEPTETADELARTGRQALETILPHECAQRSPDKNRRYDAALLFLVYPLEVVGDPMASLIVHDINHYLMGKIGVRRYLRDSYYAPDFDRRYPAAKLTSDHSAGTGERDRLIEDVGQEAQWCLFDPILSAYYGSRQDRDAQTLHFNRALAQITDEWRCPELYYLRTNDSGGRREYRTNGHEPLQWTQANLLLAIETLRATVNGR